MRLGLLRCVFGRMGSRYWAWGSRVSTSQNSSFKHLDFGSLQFSSPYLCHQGKFLPLHSYYANFLLSGSHRRAQSLSTFRMDSCEVCAAPCLIVHDDFFIIIQSSVSQSATCRRGAMGEKSFVGSVESPIHAGSKVMGLGSGQPPTGDYLSPSATSIFFSH